MFCKNCGKEIPEGASFCPKCGLKLKEDPPKREENKSSEEVKKVAKEAGSELSKGLGKFFDNWKTWSGKKKFLSVVVCCCIGWIVLAAIIGALSPDANTSDDSDSSGEIKLIKTITRGYDYKSDGELEYTYMVDGVVKNLPGDAKGYTLKGTFYGNDGSFVKEKDAFLDLDYSNKYYFKDSEPSTLLLLTSDELINMTDVEIIIMDPEGDVIVNETVPFKMQNMDLSND